MHSHVSPVALKILLWLSFLIDQILRPFTFLIPFLTAFSSVVYITFHLQSQLHLWKLFMTYFCNSKQITDCTLKCTIMYTNVCIIYGARIALYAYVKYRLSIFRKCILYFKIRLWNFWPWIGILFFSNILEAKHG